MVIPILLYCSEVWGPYMLGKITTFEMFKNKMFKLTNEIEKFHLKFCKRILGVHSKSTNVAVYAELGRLPLIVPISVQIVKYWLNIMDLTFNETLVGEAAQVCMRMNFQPALYVNYVLKMCKTNVDDLAKSATNPRNAPANFCHYLKELLHNEFVTHFKNQIQQHKENGKLRLFRKVKVNFNFEYYLSQVQNVKHRQAVTKLRISAHKLPVETGRYKNIPYNDRICKHCDLNEIGNEQHYLMSCSNTMFRTLRNKFIDNLYKINRSLMLFNMQDLFHYVLAMKDKNIIKISSKYCFDILEAFDLLE